LRHGRKVDREAQFGSGTISPTHRTALGLDPRATLSTAQAANGPRIKSEDDTVIGGDMDADLSILSPPQKPRAYFPRPRHSRGPDAGPGGETVGRGRPSSEGNTAAGPARLVPPEPYLAKSGSWWAALGPFYVDSFPGPTAAHLPV